jgi:hypothetical protein
MIAAGWGSPAMALPCASAANQMSAAAARRSKGALDMTL